MHAILMTTLPRFQNFNSCPLFLDGDKDNQRNGLETQAKSLMTSVIRPDTLYFGTL